MTVTYELLFVMGPRDMKHWAKFSKITWGIYDEYECKEAALNESRYWEMVEEGWLATKLRCSRHVGTAALEGTSQSCCDWLREETAKRWSPEIGGVWLSMESHAHWGKTSCAPHFSKTSDSHEIFSPLSPYRCQIPIHSPRIAIQTFRVAASKALTVWSIYVPCRGRW